MFTKWLICHETHEKIEKALESLFDKKNTCLNCYTSCYILNCQENKELRLSDLAPHLCLSNSATSRLVAKLEQETGFVRRKTCEEDNRGLYVILTEKGQAFLEEMTPEVNKLLKDLL